jgi:lysozyme
MTPLEKMLIQDEGLRLKPYRCTAGKLTIGVGHNLDALGITEAEAMFILMNDIKRVTLECEKSFDFWPFLDEERKCVLLNMCFNLGLDGLLKFKRTLTAISDGRYEDAAAFMLDSKWAQQVGQRAVRLSKIMATGNL